MSSQLFWRAGAVQMVAVIALFLLLLAAPLPDDFFRSYGAAAGPLAWIACALVAGRVLSLPMSFTLACAVGSGVVAAIAGVVLSHLAGLLIGIVVFGAFCSLRGTHRPAGDEASIANEETSLSRG